MEPLLLQVQNLSVDFISEGVITPAVKDISFDISPGQIVAIVGESGSGKSVTSLALMGLLSQQAIVKGKAQLNLKSKFFDLLQPGSKQNTLRGKDIAMIFQEPMTSLNPVFTCGEQVVEAILQHQQISKKKAVEQAVTLFEKVQLPNPASFIKKYPHQISGGQKQRVMIAMAMSNSPALLIADEPTTALDVTVQKTILELMKNLRQQNQMGILLITHDMGLVADVADNVLVMYKGTIVEQGSTADVLQNPVHPYTKALMACRPAGHARGEKLPVVNDFFKEDGILNTDGVKRINHPVNNQLVQDKIVLEVKHLSVFFNAKRTWFIKTPEPYKAVNDVSFSVKKGETLGLVGESGCGKTTLGRTILQLIQATSGSIILNGTDITSLAKTEFRLLRKDLQIVFQDPYGSLNPRITIGEAILEPMTTHHIANGKTGRENVMELLEKVNLQPDHFNRYPHQFSGGQRQRICIARALALNPSFLIFDESVSALDVSVQAQVLNLLNDLKNEFNFTSIFISHDLSVVRYISDRIMVMKEGKIVEQGNADDIYFSPKNEYTRQLIAAIPGKNLSK